MKLYYFIVLTILFWVSVATCASILYVDTSSNCQSSCNGATIQSAFKNFDSAISYINSKGLDNLVLLVKEGTYRGFRNKDITIEGLSIEITSMSGLNQTIIDCEETSAAFIISNNVLVTIDGFTIRNCHSNLGGAISVAQSSIVLKGTLFQNNRATYGGAIYSLKSKVNIIGCQFKENSAIKGGGALYSTSSFISIRISSFTCSMVGLVQPARNEIECDKSTISIDEATPTQGFGFSCSSSCHINKGKSSICNQIPSKCTFGSNGTLNATLTPTSTPLPTTLPTESPNSPQICLNLNSSSIPTQYAIGDGFCHLIYENCLNSPLDCKSCYFSGVVLESLKGSDMEHLTSVSNTSTPFDIKSFMYQVDNELVVGKVRGYLRVPKTGYYRVQIVGSNIGVSVSINDIYAIHSMFQQQKVNTSNIMFLDANIVNSIRGTFFSSPSIVGRRSIIFKIFDSVNDKELNSLFYSQNNCGDGIYEGKGDCLNDIASSDVSHEPYCGDGVCNEQDPNSCFVDCYKLITPTCPTRNIPAGHLPPGFKVEYDTLGWLVSNQFLWHLPGSEHMTYAIDIVNGKEGKSPLFYFGYCDSTASKIVEDVYRMYVYDVPKEMDAKILPECKFSTSSNIYQNITQISTDMYLSSNKEYSVNAGPKIKVVQLEASFAFTEEESVEQSSKLLTSNTQSLVVTELVCKSSVMEMSEEYTFHPVFLQQLSQVENVEMMYDIMNQYGTHTRKKAIFGGKLTQLTMSDKIEKTQESEQEWKYAATRSFAGSLGSPVFTARASYQDSIDQSISSSRQEEMEMESTRSSIITKGGPLGAFGPSQTPVDEFDQWAKNVDFLPVPIEYDLIAIRNILNKEWWLPLPNVSVVDMWIQAEELFYQRRLKEIVANTENNNFLMTLHLDAVKLSQVDTLPIFKIKWFIENPIVEGGDPLEMETRITLPFREDKQFSSDPVDGSDFDFRFTSLESCTKSNLVNPPMYYRHGRLGQLLSPYRVNFSSPNFIESVGPPKLSIENLDPSIFTRNITITSFTHGSSIVFDPITGQPLYERDHIYLDVATENQFARDCTSTFFIANSDLLVDTDISGEIPQGCLENDSAKDKIPCYLEGTMHENTLSITNTNLLSDGAKINFGPITVWHTSNNNFYGEVVTPYYLWDGFRLRVKQNVTTAPTLTYTTSSIYGMGVRMNWYLIVGPSANSPSKTSPTDNWWMRKTYAGHYKYTQAGITDMIKGSEGSATITGKELIESKIPIYEFTSHNLNNPYSNEIKRWN